MGLMQNSQSPLFPLQHSSKASFYFKDMCNLCKASKITHVLKVKHRLKIASLAVGQGVTMQVDLAAFTSSGSVCWALRPSLQWDDRVQSKATMSGEDKSGQCIRENHKAK